MVVIETLSERSMRLMADLEWKLASAVGGTSSGGGGGGGGGGATDGGDDVAAKGKGLGKEAPKRGGGWFNAVLPMLTATLESRWDDAVAMACGLLHKYNWMYQIVYRNPVGCSF